MNKEEKDNNVHSSSISSSTYLLSIAPHWVIANYFSQVGREFLISSLKKTPFTLQRIGML